MKNSFDEIKQQVVSVEVLHLDEMGYGPEGLNTRRQWREICLRALLAERGSFATWFTYVTKDARNDLSSAEHGYVITYADGSHQNFPTYKSYPAYAADFVGLDFTEFLDASGVQFAKPALFSGATFRQGTDFSDAHFVGYSGFKSATFKAATNFRNSKFDSGTGFDLANFEATVDFGGGCFASNAAFSHTTFCSTTVFVDAVFKGPVVFIGAEFREIVVFIRTIFSSTCFFHSQFENAGKNYRRHTIFREASVFESATFKNVGHFERVRFVKLVPSFLGVETATTRLEFSGDSYFPQQDRTEDAVAHLGHLKRLSDEHGQTDQALNFNALELHAKAGLATTGRFTKLVTWIYGAVSDYGRSFARPVATYAALLLITLLLATGHAAFSLPRKDCKGASLQVLSDLWRTTEPCLPAVDDKLHLSGYRAAAEYTLYRAAGVLDFSDNGKATDAVARRLFGQPIEPWWMRVWGVFKAIASTALLFLTALGLRNKYRIK